MSQEMVQYFNNFSISGHPVAKTDTIEYPVVATRRPEIENLLKYCSIFCHHAF